MRFELLHCKCSFFCAQSFAAAEIRKEVKESLKPVDERIQWVVNRENNLMAEEARLNEVREELDEKMRKIDEGVKGSSVYFSPDTVPV
jgi:hypothetical protein